MQSSMVKGKTISLISRTVRSPSTSRNALRRYGNPVVWTTYTKQPHFSHVRTTEMDKYDRTVSSSIYQFFSTDVFNSKEPLKSDSDQTVLSDLPSDPDELQKLALKYARQDNPNQASQLLERLLRLVDETPTNFSQVGSTAMDAWIKYQNRKITELNESSRTSKDSESDSSNNKIRFGDLKEICHAAKSISWIVESIPNPSTHHFVAALKAWANASEAGHRAGVLKSSITRGIPQRMQHLLDKQEKPTTESYNQVLKAWAYSGEHLRGSMSDQIFRSIPEPNGESYKLIVRAWSLSKERRSAFLATGYYMKMMRLLEFGQTDMEPTMDDYHVLFSAWTQAEDKHAPSKVQTVLQIMESAHEDGHAKLRPDEVCYRDALVTASRRLNVPEVGEIADETLAAMKQRMMVPDSTCYGAAILAWKNVAASRECEDRERSIRRTIELLREMTQAYHRTTKVLIKPTANDYNHVLEALTRSKSSRAIDKSEMLLDAMEKADIDKSKDDDEDDYNDGWEEQESTLRPNADSYRLVLDVWCNSRSLEKVNHAAAILERMKKRYAMNPDSLVDATSTGNAAAITDVFSSFIRVCANPFVRKESLRLEILKTALKSLEDMRELGLEPNAKTYTVLLEACHQLLPEGRDRQRFLENVFRQCCEDGYVDQSVLAQFQSSAATSLYTTLVVVPSQEVEGTKVVPDSWTRNIKEFMANTKQGRKVLPLSIDGKFTSTVAQTEYKMRKMRRRHNQRMLQGGRMK